MESWIAEQSCTSAARLGWTVGVDTGTFVDAVLIVTIALAPTLTAARRDDRTERAAKARAWLRRSLSVLPATWTLCAIQTGPFLVPCYVPAVATAVGLIVVPLILLLIFTAANQIAPRTIR